MGLHPRGAGKEQVFIAPSSFLVVATTTMATAAATAWAACDRDPR